MSTIVAAGNAIDLDALTAEKDELEITWLEAAEQAG